MPHWILALRSRKRSGSPASALDHRDREEHVDRDEDGEQVEAARRRPARTAAAARRRTPGSGCGGRRAAWASSVMNSRSAKKRDRCRTAGSRRPAQRPGEPEQRSADPQRAQVAREALVLALRRPGAIAQAHGEGGHASPAAARRRAMRTAARPAGSAPRSRSAFMPVHAVCAQRDHGLARAGEEGALALRPAAAAIGAPKVTVHRIGTGTTSPLGITRCTLSIQAGTSCTCGKPLGQVEQAALERLRLAACAARALGKDHQRVAALQRLDQRLERVLVVGALPRLT